MSDDEWYPQQVSSSAINKITLPGTVHAIIPLDDGSLWVIVMGDKMKLLGYPFKGVGAPTPS